MIYLCDLHGHGQGTLASPDVAASDGPPLKLLKVAYECRGLPVIAGLVSEDFAMAHGIEEGLFPLTESTDVDWAELCVPVCCECMSKRHGPLGLDFGYPEN